MEAFEAVSTKDGCGAGRAVPNAKLSDREGSMAGLILGEANAPFWHNRDDRASGPGAVPKRGVPSEWQKTGAVRMAAYNTA
jgi:hypothetical protein